jgi:CRP-like cAMP-binding protein
VKPALSILQIEKLNRKVKNIIDSIYPLSEKSFLKIEKLLEYKTFKKGEIFILKNSRDENEYFVLEGVCKSYLMNPEGEDITISFFKENSILSPHSIRTSKNISNIYFKALTNLQLAAVNAQKFEYLMIENDDVRAFANTVLHNELILKVQKEIGLASLSAKERLLAFRKKNSLLENLVPHTDIASYLGITNISLSRLRKELLK